MITSVLHENKNKVMYGSYYGRWGRLTNCFKDHRVAYNKNAEHFCHVLRPKRLSRLPILGRT